jgi:hypothetical protein
MLDLWLPPHILSTTVKKVLYKLLDEVPKIRIKKENSSTILENQKPILVIQIHVL